MRGQCCVVVPQSRPETKAAAEHGRPRARRRTTRAALGCRCSHELHPPLRTGVIGDAIGHRLLAAGQKRHLVAGIDQLAGQVHANEAGAAWGRRRKPLGIGTGRGNTPSGPTCPTWPPAAQQVAQDTPDGAAEALACAHPASESSWGPQPQPSRWRHGERRHGRQRRQRGGTLPGGPANGRADLDCVCV